MIPCDQGKVKPSIDEDGLGGVDTISSGAPNKVAFDKSVRTSFAKRTAPSTFNSPAPCSRWLKPASGCAVNISTALTRFGVRREFAWSNKAAAPAATGVAIEVPDRYIMRRDAGWLASTFSSGWAASRLLHDDAAPMILLPGAISSGFRRLS